MKTTSIHNPEIPKKLWSQMVNRNLKPLVIDKLQEYPARLISKTLCTPTEFIPLLC